MSPTVERCLSICDQSAIALWAEGDRIKFRTNGDGLPDDVRNAITANRTEVFDLLQANARPFPDPVWFVARDLDITTYPQFISGKSVAIFIGDRRYYQLTPAVWVCMAKAADKHFPSSARESKAYIDAFHQMQSMFEYVKAHFRPDQIDRAFSEPSFLPKAVMPPQ